MRTKNRSDLIVRENQCFVEEQNMSQIAVEFTGGVV